MELEAKNGGERVTFGRRSGKGNRLSRRTISTRQRGGKIGVTWCPTIKKTNKQKSTVDQLVNNCVCACVCVCEERRGEIVRFSLCFK